MMAAVRFLFTLRRFVLQAVLTGSGPPTAAGVMLVHLDSAAFCNKQHSNKGKASARQPSATCVTSNCRFGGQRISCSSAPQCGTSRPDKPCASIDKMTTSASGYLKRRRRANDKATSLLRVVASHGSRSTAAVEGAVARSVARNTRGAHKASGNERPHRATLCLRRW